MRTPSAMPLICVTDLDRSTQFYGGLGFDAVGDFKGSHPGLDAAMQLPGAAVHARKLSNADGVSIELVAFSSPATLPADTPPAIDRIGHSHMVFYTPDLKAAIAAAMDSGGTPQPDTLTAIPGGLEALFVHDPDGTRVELVAGGPGRGYSHPALVVSDLERSARFYAAFGYASGARTAYPQSAWGDRLNQRDGLALNSQILENEAGDRLQLFVIESHAAAPIQGLHPFNRPGWVNLGFEVDGLDRAAADVQALGGRMIEGTRAVIGPREQWHATDPDGLRVKLVANAA